MELIGISLGNYSVGWLEICKCFTASEGKSKKSKKKKKTNFSKLLLWGKLEGIRKNRRISLRKRTEMITEMYPLENQDFEVRKLNIFSAMSAQWTFNRNSTSIFLGKNAPTMLEKAVLVCVYFSRDDIYFSVREAVFLGSLSFFPSFPDRKMGEGTPQG